MAKNNHMNALTPILEYKRSEVAKLKASRSFAALDNDAKAQSPPRGFAAALDRLAEDGQNGLICELKRKSPSAGVILPNAAPDQIAKEYEPGGAACLSILTDGPSFGGSLSDLIEIRSTVNLPILRKDFMIDTDQIVEARAAGADAILVIMAAVTDPLARDLTDAAHAYDMDVLIEVHNEIELKRALELPDGLLGINNRDLTAMKTDLSVTERLSALVPAGRPFVSESGVKSADDISRLRASGAKRFLIGESLMLSNQRTALVTELKEAS